MKLNNEELVLRALNESGEPLRPGEIAEKAGLDKTEVDKAIKTLKKEEKIFSPKRCFYQAK
ncbi:helix-turn-helix domain-containing protein [Serpentinicella alkaliphila]|uniref:IclR-like helix-turn-helix domain-containing protein n=1 Tax=Serpentinicella alkaliphila TaxID=1734049 RepID=A0A4R2TYS6_9FIRM|nr:IclR-like helix-turn-helix domain-containing protein [Serpentinicella alkaliphila]